MKTKADVKELAMEKLRNTNGGSNPIIEGVKIVLGYILRRDKD